MSSTQQVLAAGPSTLNRPRRRSWHPHLPGVELTWAIAFVVPYAAVLVAFAVYPLAYGLWMASSPSLYLTLFASDEYRDAVVSTMLYVGIGVNTSVFFALLLSGFFMRRSRWVKAMLVVSMLPWALPAQTGFISFHWMMVYWGFLEQPAGEAVRHIRSGLVDPLLARARSQHHRLDLEDDAVLDPDSAGGADGDPSGSLRSCRYRRGHRLPPLRPSRGAAAGEPLPRLHVACRRSG